MQEGLDISSYNRKLLSGLIVPDYVDESELESTAPLDVVDRDQAKPTEPERVEPEPEKPQTPAVPPAPVVVVETEPRQIAPPKKPEDGKWVMQKALTVGYWMSVGVGIVGQISAFGSLIANSLSPSMKPLAYCAAAVGAAFAEITMVGTGTAALRRRYEGGSWRLLAITSWIVCLYAVILNALHWAPVSIGLAVMFSGGSALGFSAHSVAEHLAAHDYERRLAEYEAAVAELQEAQRRQAEQARKAAEAERKAAERTERKAAAERKSTPTPSVPSKPKTGGQATMKVALEIGAQRRAMTPSQLKAALVEAGYTLPRSSTTLENWCRRIREQLSV